MTVVVPQFSGALPTQSDLINYEANSGRFMAEFPAILTAQNLQNVENNAINAALVLLNDALAPMGNTTLALANYKGHWSNLTGALNMPASVSHAGAFWVLTANLANVTTATPGVSGSWTKATAVAADVVYTPGGGVVANNVQAAIAEVYAAIGTQVSAQAAAQATINAMFSGMLGYFPTTTAPSGWIKANGAVVSRTTYAGIFARYGTLFGAGDGSTTFGLPELRAEVVMGWDDGRGVDSGRVLGSWQAESVLSHSHTASSATAGNHTHPVYGAGAGATTVAFDATVSPGRPINSLNTIAAGDHSHTITVNAFGGTANRVRNVAWLACIKI